MAPHVTPTEIRKNAAEFLPHVHPAPRYHSANAVTMAPAANDHTPLLGNWPEFNRDTLPEREAQLDDSFNSLYGVFRIGHYMPPCGIPRQVYLKEYGASERYPGEGLPVEQGYREAAGLAGLEFLGVAVPRYVLHPGEKWAAKLEVRGCPVSSAPRHLRRLVSKEQLLDFSAANAMVGSWDVDSPDVFIDPEGRLWPIDLDSSIKDLTSIGEWSGIDDPRYERHIAYTQELAEHLGLDVARKEILDADRRLACCLLNEGAAQKLCHIVEQYVPSRSGMLQSQIEDLAAGDLDGYLGHPLS